MFGTWMFKIVIISNMKWETLANLENQLAINITHLFNRLMTNKRLEIMSGAVSKNLTMCWSKIKQEVGPF